MHKCTEMHSNELQMAQVHWQVPVLLLNPTSNLAGPHNYTLSLLIS